jgi:hypothetical protein
MAWPRKPLLPVMRMDGRPALSRGMKVPRLVE